MKRELGKWLMDIAKYMATALLISSVFGDISNGWILVIVTITMAALLIGGLYLVGNKQKTED